MGLELLLLHQSKQLTASSCWMCVCLSFFHFLHAAAVWGVFLGAGILAFLCLDLQQPWRGEKRPVKTSRRKDDLPAHQKKKNLQAKVQIRRVHYTWRTFMPAFIKGFFFFPARSVSAHCSPANSRLRFFVLASKRVSFICSREFLAVLRSFQIN